MKSWKIISFFFTSIFCACSFILTRVCILRLHRKSLQDPKTKAFKKPLQIACKTFANLRWLAKNSATSIWSNEYQWMYQIHWSLCIFELPLAAAWSSSSSLYKENTNKRIKGLWCASSLLFELQTFRRHWTTSSRETQCTKVCQVDLVSLHNFCSRPVSKNHGFGKRTSRDGRKSTWQHCADSRVLPVCKTTIQK